MDYKIDGVLYDIAIIHLIYVHINVSNIQGNQQIMYQ